MEITRPESKQLMPPHAKLVFKGMIFDVYQWEQEGYDGSKHVFEKLKRPDTVVVIPVTADGQIIVTTQEQPGKKPFTALAGGRVDEGEDVLAAAKRELLEETGYASEEWELFNALQPVSKIEWAVYYFVARNCKKVAEQSLDGAEKVDVMFKNWDEFIELASSTDFYEEELKEQVLRGQLDPIKMAEFKHKIFG